MTIFILDYRLGEAKGHLQPCSTFGWGSAVAEEVDPSLMAVCRRMATCDSREKPQTAPLMTWQGMAADLGVRGFPQMAIYFMVSVSGYLLPVRRDYRGQTDNVTSRRLELAGQSLLREAGLGRGAETGSHERIRPGRARFRIQLHRLSGTDPHQSETSGAGRFGAVSK